jgi:hypothetical protein
MGLAEDEKVARPSGPQSKAPALILKALWVYSYATLLAIFAVLQQFEKKRSGMK